ncbi:MAG: SsrA-binding protein SmpB [Calditrichaeota bacterium]|nr:MAG: SsrA-binding protein SmpB [Calditrichota bacterium]
MTEEKNVKYIAKNRKARHDYTIVETIEAGISLLGSEVKSLREGKVTISDAYAEVSGGEIILKNLHISQYKMATRENHDPLRPRRLLLHKREIRKLFAKTEQKGMTLIPLAIYLKGNRVKIELAVAVGRKKYDKRDALAKADAAKKIKQAMKKDY